MKGMMLFANEFEDIEALGTLDLIRRAKIEIETVSITGDKVLLTQSKVNVLADKLIEEINLDDYDNIINLYVTVEDTNKSMIGEIVDIKEDKAVINLLGEYQNGNFVFGISTKPSFKSNVSLMPKDKVNDIIGLSNSFSV